MHNIIADSVRDLRWASNDGTKVNCIVKFSHLKEEHEFTAYAFDCEPHGRDIWSRCVNGSYGSIKSYLPPKTGETIPSTILPDDFKIFSSFLEIVNSDNAKKSFRSVAILWGCMLDDVLKELLATYKSSNLEANIKANTLNLKIKKSSEYKLIDNQQKTRLEHMRHIRNEVAHNWSLTLENKSFREHLRSLYELDHVDLFEYVDDLEFLVQMIFSGSCAKIVMEIKSTTEALQNPAP